jgi:hypothetical protein
MDPNACLHAYYDAIEAGEYEEAAEHWDDLADWIRRGGYPPEVWLDVQAEGQFWRKPHGKERP